jgi:hypothetical protein
MIQFQDDYTEQQGYWAIDLPESFPDYRADATLHFQLITRDERASITVGDVIFGFIDDQIIVACQVLDMLTPPDLQTRIHDHKIEPISAYTLTTVSTRVMFVNLGGLYKAKWRMTEQDHALMNNIDKALSEGRERYNHIRGAAWAFDFAIGDEAFNCIEITKPARKWRAKSQY